jgi:hypothetical protein
LLLTATIDSGIFSSAAVKGLLRGAWRDVNAGRPPIKGIRGTSPILFRSLFGNLLSIRPGKLARMGWHFIR